MTSAPEPSAQRSSGKGANWRRWVRLVLLLAVLVASYRHFTRPVLPFIHGRPIADVVLDACDGKTDKEAILKNFSAVSAPLLGDILVRGESTWSGLRRRLEPHVSAQFLQFLPPPVDLSVRQRTAASLLSDMSTNAALARSQLISALENNSGVEVMVLSTVALGNIGVPIPEAVPALIQLANSTNPFVLYNTWPRLSRLGVPADAALPALTRGLHATDPGVRFAALNALFHYGTQALPALDSVLKLVHSEDSTLRSMAIQALGAMGSTDSRVIDGLVSALHETDLQLQILAMNALGQLGPGAKPAVPRIVEAMRNNVGGLWRFGRTALLKIAPETPEAREALHEQ